MKALYLVLLLAAAGMALAVSQTGGPNPGVDGYGTLTTLAGNVYETPYSVLHAVTGERNGEPLFESWILVKPAKEGAGELIQGLHDEYVELSGTALTRNNIRIFEVVQVLESEETETAYPRYLPQGEIALEGEIVDTKCAAGRMKPGSGVAHRECAIRCISGGIAPALMVPHEDDVRFFLLEGPDGRAVNQAVLPFVGDPVRISGELFRWGDLQVLRMDPARIERLLWPDR